MSKLSIAILALAIFTMAAATARALPPPKSDAELLKDSDLVVDATVKSIVCDGPPVVTASKTTTKYISTLWPSKAYKGSMPKSFTIKGESYVYSGTPPTGGWHQQPMPEGWVGKLYLKLLSDGSYTKVWWNADKEDTKISLPKALPTCASDDAGVPDAGVVDSSPAGDSAPAADSASATDGATVADSAPVADSSPGSDSGPAADSAVADSGSTSPPADDGGCSLIGATASGAPWALLALFALALIARRRRR